MKKRTFAIFLAASLGASILGGCSKGNEAGSPAVSSAPSATAQDQTDAKQEQTAAAAKSSASGTSAPDTSVSDTSVSDTSVSGAGTSADSPKLPDLTGHTLMIYCGAGMAAPFQEIADAFKDATGCQVNATYANAGQIQSQITTTEEGDMFVAGSGDELKPVESYVEDKKDLVKHIPVLAVQEGNPKNITGLSGLTGDGVSLIMGDVDSTPIGKIAKKAMTDAGIFDQVKIEATTAAAPQMSAALAAGEADAAIVWKENCDAEGVEIVDTKDLDPYIKTIPAASLSCASDKDALAAFNQYLDTDTVKEIWVKYGYEIVE